VIVEVIETAVIVEVRLSLRIDDYEFCLNKKSNFLWVCWSDRTPDLTFYFPLFILSFPIKKTQHELKKKKKLHVAPHLSDVGATSAKTKSKLTLGAKTAKDPIHRGLFCILIS